MTTVNHLGHLKKSALYDHFKAWLDEESAMAENLINASEEAFITFAEAYAVIPPGSLKQPILEKMKALQASANTQQALDINNLPLLNANSNWLDWQSCVEHISPPDNFDSVFLYPLEVSPNRDLYIVWVKEYVDEEVHHDLVESFLILEGSCECSIQKADGTTKVRLTVGDFIEIPIGEPHNVQITSSQPVKGILQWNRLKAV